MKEGQIKSAILGAAIAWAKTSEPCHLDKIREMAELLENRSSLSYQISRHAVAQFMRRSKCKNPTSAEGTLKAMIGSACELELKDTYKAIQLMNHNYRNARYFKHGGWLLVVCETTIVTCHHATAKRWKQMEGIEKSRA